MKITTTTPAEEIVKAVLESSAEFANASGPTQGMGKLLASSQAQLLTAEGVGAALLSESPLLASLPAKESKEVARISKAWRAKAQNHMAAVEKAQAMESMYNQLKSQLEGDSAPPQ